MRSGSEHEAGSGEGRRGGEGPPFVGLRAGALWAAGQHPWDRLFVQTQPSVNAVRRTLPASSPSVGRVPKNLFERCLNVVTTSSCPHCPSVCRKSDENLQISQSKLTCISMTKVTGKDGACRYGCFSECDLGLTDFPRIAGVWVPMQIPRLHSRPVNQNRWGQGPGMCI